MYTKSVDEDARQQNINQVEPKYEKLVALNSLGTTRISTLH